MLCENHNNLYFLINNRLLFSNRNKIIKCHLKSSCKIIQRSHLPHIYQILDPLLDLDKTLRFHHITVNKKKKSPKLNVKLMMVGYNL